MIHIKSKSEQERPFNLLAWGHWFALGNLFLALAFSSAYLITSEMPSSIIGWLYMGINWIGHFAFLCIAAFILTIFPFVTIFPYKRHIRGLAATFASILQLLLVLDVLTYIGLGYHLSAVSFSQLREVEDVYIELLGDGYWYLLLGVFLLILVYQFTLSNFTWKRIYWLQSLTFKNLLARVLLTFFVSSHLIHLWADATINTDVAKQANLYPLSYPLTAKTLLASYDVIDLEERQKTQTKFAFINEKSYQVRPVTFPKCKSLEKQYLDVQFVNAKQYSAVERWLRKNNVKFSYNPHFFISTDLDSLIYNFKTGLPAYYQQIGDSNDLDINNIFGYSAININVLSGEFNPQTEFKSLQNNKIFVFLPEHKSEFTRAKTLIVGFDIGIEQRLSPQVMVASFVSEKLKCSEFVKANLVDSGYQKVSSDYIHVNYSNESLGILYKDKMMEFKQGKFVANKTFTSLEDLQEPVDLTLVAHAVEKLTTLREVKE